MRDQPTDEAPTSKEAPAVVAGAAQEIADEATDSDAQTTEPIPSCPKCGRPMVRRTARRGANEGSEFWGCPEFPRCRGTVRDQPTDEAPASKEAPAVAEEADAADEVADPDADGKSDTFLTKIAKTVDKGWRWYLESDEPDATGRWDDNHRRRMLSYVYDRDGGRCGLCAGETKKQGAQIEHVVPKVFAMFDVGKSGRAEPGTSFKSRLHKIDNLQAAHSYCNKRKGNTSDVSKWRHPAMPPLTVADAEDGRTFELGAHIYE